MNICVGKGTIGEYTVTEETTMKQIDTAQLDITACQAQAAEYHARGFNCAQAVACTLAPAVGLDPQTAFILTEGFGAGMGGMTETCGAISGAVAIMGFVMSDGMENPKTKGQTYKLSREIAKRFKTKNTTTVCGTLKGIGSDNGPLRSCPGCIDDAIDIHDFRMVAGPTHTNLIFDAVVPFGFRLTDQEVEQKIRSAVRALDGNYYAVVNVERSYT